MVIFLSKVLNPEPLLYIKEKILFVTMMIEAAKAYATEFKTADSYEQGVMIGTAIATLLSFFISGAGIAKTATYMLDSLNLLRETGAITSILQKAFQGTTSAARLANAKIASKTIDLASKALKSITSALKTAPETIFSKVKSVISNGDQLKLITNTGVEVNISEAKLISRLKTVEKMTDDEAKAVVECLKNQCFSGDTLVTTKDGLKRIDSIQVGDYVLAKDVNNNIIDYKEVKNVYVKNTYEFVHLKFNNEEIRTTASHLFFTDSGWWKPARELNVGDKILNSEGEFKSLVSTSVEALDEPEKIYNLNVDEFHTYFVGTNGLLVHNDCLAEMMAAGRDAIAYAKKRDIADPRVLSEIGSSTADAIGIAMKRGIKDPDILANLGKVISETIINAPKVADEFVVAIRNGTMYGNAKPSVACVVVDITNPNIFGRGVSGIWKSNPSIINKAFNSTEEFITFYRNTLTDSYIDGLVAANPAQFAGKNIAGIKAEMAKLRAMIQKTKDAAKNANPPRYFNNSPLEPSFQSEWVVENCAEIWAVRDAIMQGSKLENIVLRSVNVADGKIKLLCDNCMKTFADLIKAMQ